MKTSTTPRPSFARRGAERRKSALDVRVVLVRPRNPLNIGAAARAMANFGLSDMVVVKPYAPVWRETVSAVGAEKLVLAAKAVDSIDEAIADRHLVLGTTTARHRTVERPLVRLPDLLNYLSKNMAPSASHDKIAILFGSEKTGLSNNYLERCHALLTVPTSLACPSMNLGQAVATVCYELSRDERKPALWAEKATISPLPPATVGEMRQLVRHAMELFDATGYIAFLPERDRVRKVWRTFLRWNVRRSDLALMHGIFRHVLKTLRPDR